MTQDPTVTIGDNNLDTCLQFKVKDKNKDHFLTVKAYDKMVDLIARDGCLPVGSRLSTILGCKR